MNNESKAIIVSAIVFVLVVSTILYSRGYFEVPAPELRISLTEVNKYIEKDIQNVWVQKDGVLQQENRCIGINVSASFTIVNSGDIDGFINVQLELKGESLILERYFVRGGDEEKKRLYESTVECDITEKDIAIISNVDKP